MKTLEDTHFMRLIDRIRTAAKSPSRYLVGHNNEFHIDLSSIPEATRHTVARLHERLSHPAIIAREVLPDGRLRLVTYHNKQWLEKYLVEHVAEVMENRISSLTEKRPATAIA